MSALDPFRTDLDKLADLDDAALQTLEGSITDAFDAADAANNDADANELADALDQVRMEKSKRSPDAAAAPDAAATADAAPVEASAAPTEGEGAPAVTAEEGITVAQSTVQVPSGHAPVVASAPVNVVYAGADLPNKAAGTEFTSGLEFGTAMAHRINTLRNVTGGDGEQIMVASIMAPEVTGEKLLNSRDPEGNRRKIEAATNEEMIREFGNISSQAVTAAGGLCAPLATRYDLFDCGGVTDRPVRDSLVGFQADRGGLRWFSAPALADLQPAVGFWTSTDDADAASAGLPNPVKACARIACPTESTAEIQAVTLCLTFGVMQSRVFPETTIANNKLALVAHARLAESALLAQIKAGSVQVSEGSGISAVRDLLNTIGRISLYYRDRYRLDKDMPLRAIFPAWLLEVLRGDIMLGDPESDLRRTLSMTDADITGFFSDRKINVTWALDSAVPGTLGGGFFPAMTTTIPAFPSSVQWALFAEGSWLFLDGGQLDLGIVRDSTLVKVNDYMQFSETFEAATRIGCESLWITSALALTGQYMGPRTDPAFLAATAANA